MYGAQVGMSAAQMVVCRFDAVQPQLQSSTVSLRSRALTVNVPNC